MCSRHTLRLGTLTALVLGAAPAPLAQTIPGSPGSHWFGQAIAHGDFDGNGVADLAIGAHFDDVDGVTGAGSVTVIYNGRSAVGGAGAEVWTQDSPGTPDQAEEDDVLGVSLVAGDFNGDGIDDLAAGAIGETIDGQDWAGAVLVLYGSDGGLTATGSQFWHQNSADIEGTAEPDDEFGLVLAAGDFDGDGADDLAVGVYVEDIESIEDAGVVHVIYGSAAGLTSVGNQRWSQNSEGLEGAPEADDRFGYSLAAGDFDGDGRDDLVVGVPGEHVGGVSRGGTIQILPGSAAGLTASGSTDFHQDSEGIEGQVEQDDRFGYSLAVGDFDGDDRVDLAVGIFGEPIGSVDRAGAVAVLYSAAGGLTATGSQFWSQDGGIAGDPEEGDRFGSSLAAGDLDGDGRDDLAVGVPREDVGGVADAGAVNVIFGGRGGLTDVGNQLWDQTISGLRETAETGDLMGSCLAAADLDGDGVADLAIGMAFEDLEDAANSGLVHLNAGLVHVLFGEPNSGLTGEGSARLRQGGGLPVAAEAAAPEGLYRLGAAPNPVATRSAVRFEVPEAGDVRLEVVDTLGRSVVVLASGPHAAGAHEAAFDAGHLPAGVYVVRLGAGSTTLAMPVTVAR